MQVKSLNPKPSCVPGYKWFCDGRNPPFLADAPAKMTRCSTLLRAATQTQASRGTGYAKHVEVPNDNVHYSEPLFP